MSSTRHRALRRVLVPEAAGRTAGSLIALDGDKAKHLRKVLRLEWDDTLAVLDGAGRLFEATLVQQGSGAAVRLGELKTQESAPPALELVIVLAKNTTMDWVVEKAVECGATRIVPVVSSRSVVKPAEGEEGKYARRWQTIMDGAVEQSERLWRPLVSAPKSWRELVGVLRKNEGELKTLAFLSELRQEGHAEDALANDLVAKLRQSCNVGLRLVIGPEGGFADEERDELLSLGAQSASLGNAVLRVETAVVAALTLSRVIRLLAM